MKKIKFIFFFRFPIKKSLFFFCHWLAMSNGLYNPFIYALFSVSLFFCPQTKETVERSHGETLSPSQSAPTILKCQVDLIFLGYGTLKKRSKKIGCKKQGSKSRVIVIQKEKRQTDLFSF
jgi:hypothetical protein